MAGPLLSWPWWIGVVAEDLERQRRFYRDVLGFKEIKSTDEWVEFEVGGNKVELLARSDAPQYSERRYQVGFRVEDIGSARAELLSRGVEAISDIEGGPEMGSYWAYFKDAEGNVFEVSQRLTDPSRTQGT